MRKRLLGATIVLALSSTCLAADLSIMDECRAYARAIGAVAAARDNLDDPDWDELQKQHPVLSRIEKRKGRGHLYAKIINLGISDKTTPPNVLMKKSYESCISGNYSCLLYGKECGPQRK